MLKEIILTSFTSMSKIRLHKHLTNTLSDKFSRSEIMYNIEQYGVKIADETVFNRLYWLETEAYKANTDHWPKKEVDFSGIRIFKEEEKFFVLFKPTDLPVQHGAGHKGDTLYDWLMNTRYQEQIEIIKDAKKYNITHPQTQSNAIDTAGMVHRIDKNTQGLIVVAKNFDELNRIQHLFRARKVNKKYLAYIEGRLNTEQAKVVEVDQEEPYISIIDTSGVANNQWHHYTHYQCRKRSEPIKQILFWSHLEAYNYNDKCRKSESLIREIEYDEKSDRSLIEIKLITGRMHQIRVLCAAIGNALIGDQIYSKESFKPYVISINNSSLQSLKKDLIGTDHFFLLSNAIGFDY